MAGSWEYGFHKRRGVTWLAEQLLAPQEDSDNYVTAWSIILSKKLIATQLVKKLSAFHKNWLPSSQQHATGLYPEPDASNRQLPTLFP